MAHTDENLLTRVKHLKDLLSGCTLTKDVPEHIAEIIKTAPDLIRDLEKAALSNDPKVINELQGTMKQAEIIIESAVMAVSGKKQIEPETPDRENEPSRSPYRRLMERLNRFLMIKTTPQSIRSLAREFMGSNVAEEEPGQLDLMGRMKEFSQWVMMDIILPSHTQRLIDMYAHESMFKLPLDEQALLKSWLADRPSIYRVVKNQKTGNGIFFIQDLLSPDAVIRVRDKSATGTLEKGDTFLARPVALSGEDQLFSLLGEVTKMSGKTWAALSREIGAWSDDYFRSHPLASKQDFFRLCYPQIMKKLRQAQQSR